MPAASYSASWQSRVASYLSWTVSYLLPLLLLAGVIAAPQPKHSEGNILIYGGQSLVEANAEFRGYDLSLIPGRCGFSAISPAMLGKLAWFKTPGHNWVGPCLSVDAVQANHAIDSIYGRQEVAEVTWDTAERLGFSNGGKWGSVYFGLCPPIGYEWPAEPYAPPRDYTQWPYRWSSFWPYPTAEIPISCTIVQ